MGKRFHFISCNFDKIKHRFGLPATSRLTRTWCRLLKLRQNTNETQKAFFIPSNNFISANRRFSASSLKEDSIELFVRQKMQQLRIPAAQIAVVKDGKMVMSMAFGTANLENNIAATTESIFSINSITKAFTGVAIMQLAEEGKLNVNDPISLYLDSIIDPEIENTSSEQRI